MDGQRDRDGRTETGMGGQTSGLGRTERLCSALGLCKTIGAPGAPKALGALAAGFEHNPEDRVRFGEREAETP